MPNINITLSQKIQVKGISQIKNHETSIINSKGIVYINLFPKKKYIAQWVRKNYLTFICQFKISFNLIYSTQSINFSLDNIFALNKQL